MYIVELGTSVLLLFNVLGNVRCNSGQYVNNFIENVCNDIALEYSLSCPETHEIVISSYDLKFNLNGNPERDCYSMYDYSLSQPGSEFEKKCTYDYNRRNSCRVSPSLVRTLFGPVKINEIYNPIPKRIVVKYLCTLNGIERPILASTTLLLVFIVNFINTQYF